MKLFGKFSFVWIVEFLLVNFLSKAENRIQMFTIHKEEDCSDVGEVYTESIRNLRRVSPLVSCGAMRCFCNHHGLWIFTTYKNFKPSFRQPLKSDFTLLELPGKNCESRRVNWQFLQLNSIRHVGNRDTRVQTLNLYIDLSFFGLELSITGSQLSLPSSTNFSSFAFTGGKTWALFERPNFSGKFTCIRTSTKNVFIGFNSTALQQIGSVYYGCPKVQNLGDTVVIAESTNSLTLYTNSTSGDTNLTAHKIGGAYAEKSLRFDGAELRLSQAQIFVEFSTVGIEKWTIYSGLEFNGKFRCLESFGEETERFRFKRNIKDFGETWLIGSLRRGCFPYAYSQYEEDYQDLEFNSYDTLPATDDMEASVRLNTTSNSHNSSRETTNHPAAGKITHQPMTIVTLLLFELVATTCP